jgi:Mn2+/Fe2+ NRAMP family transporter
VQESCARIGIVTGKGIVAVSKQYYSKKVVYAVVLLVVVANTINLGADIGAMAEAANLILPIPFAVLAFLFTAAILILEIFSSYKAYARILKWLAAGLFLYLITVFIVNEPWGTILKATFIPNLEFSPAYLFIITGVLGTTISPYMFFWEASEEVEEEEEHHLLVPNHKPLIGWGYIRSMRIDNFVGMLASEIATWSIIVVTATTLNSHGITNIATAADAARALEPLVQTFPNSGFLAKLLFALGIISLGLLAVPILSGSASYAVSEAANWKEGLNLKLSRAHGFYGVITIATIIGLTINFVGIDPVKALVYSAVFNGVAAVPLIFLVAKISSNEEIMGEYKSKWLSKTIVWLTFLAMGAAAIAMLLTLGR